MADNSQYTREEAKRVLVAELLAADATVKPGGDERSPTYLVLPSGGTANRVFLVGALTNVEETEDGAYNIQINGPTGTIRAYCGQYSPQPQSLMSQVYNSDGAPPAFITVVAKPDTFSPSDSDEVYTNLQPEQMNVFASDDNGNPLHMAAGDKIAGEDIRNSWIRETIEHTLERIDDENRYGQVREHLGFDPEFAYEQERSRIIDGLADAAEKLEQVR